ncbi:MAG: ABC transporter ATP-binding protein [Deltaproteobacteria bacterium]|nr:ABC transporter ATP-binding protein [Deltaproteobacteria bacterium]MBW1928556.1 ABC transporter ATP-binding protein [Deltaproteobacteria bacterium]MBW2025320.1 ABC transporter ATP-binding protein [Deltaproteobacteria bacterium]MBW2126382.1 ABC transporter ATP-binding protein [Deltaproteobacteria bacterium]RLB22196.1 MAG: ABC transporter ATP-binding protein [Deltaproteobacteria bacterium]
MVGTALIEVKEVTKKFHGIVAVDGVSFSVPTGSIWGLIGPNGAGKSTLLNVINGIYEADSGEVFFKGRSLRDKKVFDIAQMGISRTFQIAHVFRRMSVYDNMLAPTIFLKEKDSVVRERIDYLLEFVGLTEKRSQYAYELSGGQQKLLEFARALVTDPSVLLMDEPFAGVHPEIKAQLLGNIRELNGQGKTIVLVSHDMRSVSGLCQQVTVLNFGEKLAEGPPEKVLNDRKVIEAYLGEE